MDVYWIAIGVALGIFAMVSSDLKRLSEEVKRMNYILERVSLKENIKEELKSEIDKEVKDLLDKGKKYKAINRYRILSGKDYKEAKDYIDNFNLEK